MDERELFTNTRIHESTQSSIRSWRRTRLRQGKVEAQLATQGIHCVVFGDELYPVSLQDLFDPPLVLFATGRVGLLQSAPRMSIVGTRRASSYGMEACKWVASTLVRSGVTVVSGMALGIDGTAHTAALADEGQTIAVLGCGVDISYPQSHRTLHREIAESGLIVSEYAPGSEAAKHRFPERNRIIAGLSETTIVIQAGERSGALSTALAALDLGRDVYVVPGPITTR